jgi:hypothetical protein
VASIASVGFIYQTESLVNQFLTTISIAVKTEATKKMIFEYNMHPHFQSKYLRKEDTWVIQTSMVICRRHTRPVLTPVEDLEMYVFLLSEVFNSQVMQVTQCHFCEGQVSGRDEGIACRFTACLCLACIIVLYNVSLMVCSIYYGVYMWLYKLKRYRIFFVYILCFSGNACLSICFNDLHCQDVP